MSIHCHSDKENKDIEIDTAVNREAIKRYQRKRERESRSEMKRRESTCLTLTHIEWVMDRIRAAKLKKRKEGRGKVRRQRKEILDTHTDEKKKQKTVEISSRQAARAQSAEVVCCRSQERQAGDWVLAIFCHISLSLHPSCLSPTSSSTSLLTPQSLQQHGPP